MKGCETLTKFYIIPNKQKDAGLRVTREVMALLLGEGGTIYISSSFSDLKQDGVLFLKEGELPADAECVITIGGDGTVLDASRIAMRQSIPLLGINLGRLGYLTELEPDHLETLKRLISGEYTVKEQMVLQVTLERYGQKWVMPRMPVNDVVFYRSAIGHVVSLELMQENGEGIEYLADGLILCTPVGSTAYSLSAGGPILSAGVEAICATPICPHSFFNRTLIFDVGQSLRVRNTSKTDSITVTMDGRENFMLEPRDSVVVERAPASLQLITFEERNFLDVLRNKMK